MQRLNFKLYHLIIFQKFLNVCCLTYLLSLTFFYPNILLLSPILFCIKYHNKLRSIPFIQCMGGCTFSTFVPFSWLLGAPCWTPSVMQPALRQASCVHSQMRHVVYCCHLQSISLLFLGSQTDPAHNNLDTNIFCKSLLFLSAMA